MSEIKIIDKAIPEMTCEEKIAIVNARLAQDEEGDRFNSILGLRLAEISEEGKDPKFTYKFELDPIKMNLYGGLHGGLVCGEFDVAMGFAVFVYSGKKTSTASLTVDFLRAGNGKHYIITVELDHRGRRLFHATAKLYDTDNDELCATSVGTFSVIEDNNWAKNYVR